MGSLPAAGRKLNLSAHTVRRVLTIKFCRCVRATAAPCGREIEAMLPVFTGAEGWKRSRRWRRRMGSASAARGAILQRPRGMIDIIQDSLWGRKGGKKAGFGLFRPPGTVWAKLLSRSYRGMPVWRGECPSFFSKTHTGMRMPWLPGSRGVPRFFLLRMRAGCGIMTPKLPLMRLRVCKNTRCCAGAQNFGEFEPCKTAVGAVLWKAALQRRHGHNMAV